MRRVVTAFWLACLLGSSAPQVLATGSEYSISSGTTTLDVRGFVTPHTPYIMVDRRDDTLYMRRPGLSGDELVRIPREDGKWNEDHAVKVLDWGSRNMWLARFDERSGDFFWVADEDGNERYNVYRFDPESRKEEQLTDSGYAVTYTLGKTDGRLHYLSRNEQVGLTTACVESLALDGSNRTATKHYCDDQSEYKIYFYFGPVLDESEKRAAIAVTQGEDRHRSNLAIVDLETGKQHVVTDASMRRTSVQPLAWIGDEIFYLSGERGTKADLFVYDVATSQSRLLFENPSESIGAHVDAEQGKIILSTGDESGHRSFHSYDLATRKLERSIEIPYYVDTYWWQPQRLSDGSLVLSAQTSNDRPVYVLRVDTANFHDDPRLEVELEPRENSFLASSCAAESVRYPTFDRDASGRTRMIEAVHFKPARTSSNPAAVIMADGIYYDAKKWSSEAQMFCHLGYHVFAANVRGTPGYGDEFSQLNNGDWGGGDYRDVQHARKYVRDVLGIPAGRIGIAGLSHLPVWSLTQPGNGFAFGLTRMPITDLTRFIDESVNPNWLITEMGDPTVNAQLYRDRSAINHLENLSAPLLLLHGENDVRHGVNQSRVFFSKAKALGKDVSYVELRDEGANIRRLSSWVKYYQAEADFLRRVAPLD